MDQEIFAVIRKWEEKSIKDKSELINQLGDIQKEIVLKEKKIEKLKMMIKQLKEGVQEDKNDEVKVEEVPGSSKSENCAELILPPEVWTIIIGKVTDPRDLYNCNKTCKLFQRILLPTKTAWLFGMALPLLYKHLDQESTLACRSVCKTLSAGVDNLTDDINPLVTKLDRDFLVSNGGYLGRHDFPEDPYFGGFPFVNDYPPENKSVVNKSFENMKGHPRNPIIGRTLHINGCHYEWDDAGGNIWTSLYNFLETFGRHIWHVHVEQDPNDEYKPNPPLAHRFFTKNMLELLPNLRSIYYNFTSSMNDYQQSEEYGDLVPAEYLDGVTLALNMWSDTFEHQHFLKFWIATYHKSLKKLHISSSNSYLAKREWASISNLEWSSLLELEVYNIMDNPSLEAVSDINAPNLQKLALILGDASTCDPWNFRHEYSLETLVEVCNKFCNLIDLTVGELPFCFSIRQLKSRASSKLKKLTLDTNPLPFTFLWCFPGLEELVLISTVVQDPSRKVKKKDDKFMEMYKCLDSGSIYESNVWKLLPYLETLTIEDSVYTRFGYECFVGRQAKYN